MELPDAVYDQITALSEQGNEELDAGYPDRAIRSWSKAINLLPEPRFVWDAAGWLYASIGDAYWQAGKANDARDALINAVRSSGTQDNPFVFYRLGEVQLSLGDEKNAIENLLKAYMLAGNEIFETEPEGSDLLTFLRKHVKLN